MAGANVDRYETRMPANSSPALVEEYKIADKKRTGSISVWIVELCDAMDCSHFCP